MSNNRDLKVRFGADTSGFSKGVNQVKSELTELNSAMLQNKRKQQELNAEIKSLEKQQKALKQVMSQVKTPTKEMTAEADRLQKALDKAAMQAAELKTEEQQLKGKISATTKELNEQSTAAKNNSVSMEKAGEVLKKTAAWTATAMSGLFMYTAGLAKSAGDIDDMSKKIGLSVEEVQKLMYAAELSGTSYETITGSFSKLIKNMDAATKGTGAAYEGFETLGVSVTDACGVLRNHTEVFSEVIDALGKIENETQRDAIALSILGKSAMELNPLIKGGKDLLVEFGNELEREGLILDQMQLDKLAEFDDKIVKFKSKMKASMMESADDAVDAFDELLDNSDEIVELVATLITGFAKFTGFVVDHKEAVLALVVAYGSYKAVMNIGNIISSVVTATKSLTTATQSATVAQQEMNAAANMNPYLIIAAALTTAAAGLAFYVKKANEFEQEAINNIKTIEEHNQTVEEAVYQTKAETEALKAKGERYEDLRKKSKLTAEEEKELYSIAVELEALYPNQIKLIGETSGAYYELGTQIDNVCKSLEEYAFKKAYAAELEEMYIERAQLEDRIDEGQQIAREQLEIANADEVQSVSKLQDRLNELNQEIASVESKLKGYSNSAEDIKKGTEALIKENENLAKSLSYIKEVTQIVVDAEKELADSNALSSETLEILISKYPHLKNEVNDYIEGKKTAKEVILALNNAYHADVNNNASALQQKLNTDSEYYQKLCNMNSSAINQLADTYGVDLTNYQNYSEAKLAIEKAFLSAKAKNWADYYDAESKRWVGSVKNITVYAQQLMAQGMSAKEAQAVAQQKQRDLMDTINAVNALSSLNFSADLADYAKYYVPTLTSTDGKTTSSSSGNASSSSSSQKKELSVYELANAAFKQLVDDRIEEINRLNEAEKTSADERIAAIEDEIAARQKLAETDDLQKRIDFIQAELKYSLIDDFERAELERQLEDLQTQKADRDWEDAKRAEIEAIKQKQQLKEDEYNDLINELRARESYASTLFTDLNNGYQSATSIVSNNTKVANVNFVNAGLTEGQVTQIIRDNLGMELIT